jgi:hypothetical protein
LVKFIPEIEICEGVWELVDGLVKIRAKNDASERGRGVGNWLVEIVPKSNGGEIWHNYVKRLIEMIPKSDLDERCGE